MDSDKFIEMAYGMKGIMASDFAAIKLEYLHTISFVRNDKVSGGGLYPAVRSTAWLEFFCALIRNIFQSYQ